MLFIAGVWRRKFSFVPQNLKRGRLFFSLQDLKCEKFQCTNVFNPIEKLYIIANSEFQKRCIIPQEITDIFVCSCRYFSLIFLPFGMACTRDIYSICRNFHAPQGKRKMHASWQEEFLWIYYFEILHFCDFAQLLTNESILHWQRFIFIFPSPVTLNALPQNIPSPLCFPILLWCFFLNLKVDSV